MTRVFKPDSGQTLEIQDEGGSAALTIETDGDIALTQNIYLAAGKGIYFDGGTTSANYLGGSDAYEEGTWEVALTTSGGGTIAVNTSFNMCSYIRIGNLVSCGGMIMTAGSTVGAAGTLKFSLPFAVASGSEWERYFAGSCNFYNVELGSTMWFIAQSIPGASVCHFTGMVNNSAYIELADTTIAAAGDRIGIGLQYITS